MTDRIRGTLLIALAIAIAGVFATAADAAPVTVNLRVEGITHTIFEGQVVTDEHLVKTPSDTTAHVCNGTLAGNPAGPTATTALDDAARLNGFTWDATWDAAGSNADYYPYLRIGPDVVDPSTHYWALWRNWASPASAVAASESPRATRSSGPMPTSAPRSLCCGSRVPAQRIPARASPSRS